MTDDTRRRFLQAIANEVPVERIAEVRLFRALRQGGLETGAAVIAADRPPAAAEADIGADEAADGPTPRHTVYSARYRLVLKGPDRGRWETTITPEADAPLATVEAVVRGVLHRAGEVEEPERLTGSSFRQELAAEPWTAPRP
jgi:hypothetical protein